MLTAMQFGSFVWPHNPKTYTIRFERDLAVHRLPSGGYTVEDLGRGARVMEGVGEFFGENAYRTFQSLAVIFGQNRPQTLLHPLWQSSQAWLERLVALQEPRADYVRYAFRFVEVPGAPPAQAAPAQTAQLGAGQTLWALARENGLTVQELLARNPRLKSCNDAQTGEVVRLR